MTGLIIMFIVCFSMGLLSLWIAKKIECFAYNILAISMFLSCGVIISCIEDYNEPKAIDVYRGRTTLQITYQDSISVDTVVIFKE